MKKSLIFCFSIFLLISSCTKDVTISSVNVFGFKSMAEARSQLGKYADLFLAADGSVSLESTRFNNTDVEDWDIFARFNPDPFSPRADGGDFFINDNKLAFNQISQTYLLPSPNENLSDKELSLLLKSNFGKENDVKLIRNNSIIFQTKNYVPNEIKATNLNEFVKFSGSNFLEISRGGMNLSWNKDNNNKNGIIVYLSWTGDRTDLPVNEQGTSGNKDVAIRFDDTGEATLPSAFFEGLPKKSSFTISLLRSNIEIIEGSDKKKYKFYANSWYKIQGTLID